nr:hypothetical protein BaRGS_001302 [Batillaria attramentaria]
MSVDQVPSPSLSTASSHTSDSSCESYEQLDSLESEDLQDLSKWITEHLLCSASHVQDIQCHVRALR